VQSALASAGDRRVIPSAGAVVLDEHGRLLLVRRLTEPGAGLWSIPGGKSLPGESGARTAERETAEETGLVVTAVRMLGRQLLPFGEEACFDNEDWLVTATGGALAAGDDAGEVAWFEPSALDPAELTEDLADWLRSYGVLGSMHDG
jgi:8-oxo-dGTP diphosphatase